MPNRNPPFAFVLDDSASAAKGIAHGLRIIGGVDVKQYFSIPGFAREHGLNIKSDDNYSMNKLDQVT